MPRKKTQPVDDAQQPFSQLRLLFTDQAQERYEIARPLLLDQNLSAAQRARETDSHARTVRRYVRRFEEKGMRGLFDEREVVERGRSIPELVRTEVVKLKTLYPPLHAREITTIIYARLGCRIDYKSVQRILREQPISIQQKLPFTKFHDFKEPYQARLEVIKLYYSGWNIRSISGFLGISRQHIYNLLERFEEEMFQGLVTRRSGPRRPQRKLYLPMLHKIASLQKEYPLLGRYRMWKRLKLEGITDLGESTVGAAMAFNRFVYSELAREEKKPPRVHPFKAQAWHRFWFIDHRYLIKIDGVQYYSLCILEGYSRAFLAGIVVATQARGPVLKLIHDTVRLWGAPGGIVSDRGGAFISDDYRRTWERLGVDVHYIEAGQSWQNLIETHFNIQRRLADHQFEQASNAAQLQSAHMDFMDLYNRMDHLAHARRKPDQQSPRAVLSWVRGRVHTSRQLQAAFRETLWKRLTNRSGYVVVQNYYLYAERALARQPVCLWLWEDTLQIDHQEELLASYPCAYDLNQHQLKNLGEPVLHPNRFAQQQPQLFCLEARQWQRVSQRNTLRRHRVTVDSTQRRLPGIAVGK